MSAFTEEIPSYGDLLTIEEWKDAVAFGGFVRSDGSGCWATVDKMDWASNVWSGPPPEGATHVVWFNR